MNFEHLRLCSLYSLLVHHTHNKEEITDQIAISLRRPKLNRVSVIQLSHKICSSDIRGLRINHLCQQKIEHITINQFNC